MQCIKSMVVQVASLACQVWHISVRGRQEGTAVDGSSVGWTDSRSVSQSVDNDYIITSTVSTQWLRCDVNFNLPQSQLT